MRQVACGLDHSHLLSKDGFVYSMGSNEDGKLGLGFSIKELPKSTSPRLIETLTQIKFIAVGLSHSIAIGRDVQARNSSKAYGWG